VSFIPDPLNIISAHSVSCHREFSYDRNNEAALSTELVLQVRKVIGPFAAPKKILIVSDLPKTRSGKVGSYIRDCLIQTNNCVLWLQIMRRIMRKIVAGEGDQLGDLSTLAEPGIVEVIKKKVADSQ
jgi:acetyl-CoA synthetase